MSMIIDQARQAAANNIDMRIVVSSAIGAALLGVVTFAAVKSGIKPLRTVANVAKKGSKT